MIGVFVPRFWNNSNMKEEWEEISGIVEDGRKTHPFYKDIDTESAYWWFPLFCLQPLLCLSCFAPQTFKLYGRYQKGKKECCHRLNDLLKPKRIGCTWPDTGSITR